MILLSAFVTSHYLTLDCKPHSKLLIRPGHVHQKMQQKWQALVLLWGGVYLKVCPNPLSFTDPESMKSLSTICLSIKDTLYISCHHHHYLISVSKPQWKCTRKHILGASMPLVSELPSAGKDGNAAWIIADWSPPTFSPSLPVKPDGCAPSWYLLSLPFCLTRWSLPHCWRSSDGPEQEQLPLIFTPETNSCPL